MTVWIKEDFVPALADPLSPSNGGVEVEDGGQALIFDVASDEEDGMFVRLQSWKGGFVGDRRNAEDLADNHPEFARFAGKRVRVTVEVIE